MKRVRLFANHLALSVRKQRDGTFTLVESCKVSVAWGIDAHEKTRQIRRLRSPHRDKLKLAKFRSYAAIERALSNYCGTGG
jgi:hypothetical protein